MNFAELLDSRTPPRRVGDVRLRHGGEVLYGERVPAPWGLPVAELLHAGAAIAGVACLATLLVPSALPWQLPAGLLLVAALALAAGLRADARGRRRRGFVVHFVDHTLRVDRPAGLAGHPSSVTVPFTDVSECGVTRRGRGYAIEVELRPGRPGGPARAELLADGIDEAGLEDAHRLVDVLRAAFHLP